MYQYYDLDDSRFENLVIAICKEILGDGVQGFSKGRDGGKDGEFLGTANSYPSKQEPWEGKTIIQAKHTTGVNKHFLESNFFDNESSILNKEVEKIKTMYENKKLDHYMLFANRNLTGGGKEKIINFISQKTGLNECDIAVFGNDDLDHYLYKYPYIVNMKNIDLEPLNHGPILDLNNLSEVIEKLSEVFDGNKKENEKIESIIRTSYKKKNELNKMTDDMADQLQKEYLQYVSQIRVFLNDPQNEKILSLYQDTIEEFKFQYVIPQQRELKFFDDVFNKLVQYLVIRDFILKKHRRLTRIMVFYMYWNCDIGKTDND